MRMNCFDIIYIHYHVEVQAAPSLLVQLGTKGHGKCYKSIDKQRMEM